MHAVCLTAYKDHAQLVRLIKRFDPSFFKIFVHVDKRKSTFSRLEIDQLRTLGCEVHKKYGVWWGSFSHLQAILFLVERAVANGDVDYVHIISGQDYPICEWDEFERRCDGRIFLEYEPLEDEPEHVLRRYQTYNFFYFLQGASSFTNRLYRHLYAPSVWLQKLLRMKRSRFGNYRFIFKGCVWCSLPLQAARLLRGKEARQYLKSVRTAFVPEEIYFQTYFLNSELRSLVVNNDLRFTDWTFRNGSLPAFLDESDARAIGQSTALFARKMDSEISAKLLDIIDERHFASAVVDCQPVGEASHS